MPTTAATTSGRTSFAPGGDDGIVAGQRYQASVVVRFASNTPMGCVGVGGSPDAVTMKGGVVATEPAPEPEAGGYIGFNIDKGSQTEIGSEAFDLGTIGVPETDCDETPWVILERSGTMEVTATPEGEVWLYVGGDSGFEAAHTIFYDAIDITLAPLP